MRFDHIGVVGVGTMGSGIALKIAARDIPVTAVDRDHESLGRGQILVETTLDEAVERGIYTADLAARIAERICWTRNLADLATADLVLEAVDEDRDVKRELFKELDRVCSPSAILATNTSSLCVHDLAAATSRPERVVGLHYFFPPAKNYLVEVIPTAQTAPETLKRAWTLQERIGKIPIAVADSPGFALNRFFFPWLNEAIRILDEGHCSIATIEAAACERFGIGMGPFELMNATGMAIVQSATTTLGEEIGPFYAPPQRLAAQVEKRLPWNLAGEVDTTRLDQVADRLLAVVFLTAAQLVQEGTASIADIDLGARVGLRWRAGPFALMNEVGIAHARALVDELIPRHTNLAMPEKLTSQSRSGTPFEIKLVRTTVEDSIATLNIRRPDARNTLNPQLLRELARSFGELATDPEVRAILLTGAGKYFGAGTDLEFFLQALESDAFSRIHTFARQGQDLLCSFSQCNKPVIAQVDGLAQGSGLELALACDWILATPRARFGFPETGHGIYPGLGGTQRTTRRTGVGLARYLVLSGKILDAETARGLGLIDEIVSAEDLPAACSRYASRPKPGPHTPPARLPREWQPLAEYFAGTSLEAMLADESAAAEKHPVIAEAVTLLRQRSPLAMRIAAQIIAEGAALPIHEALDLELKHLRGIFRAKDAYEGLRAAVEKRAPEFGGR